MSIEIDQFPGRMDYGAVSLLLLLLSAGLLGGCGTVIRKERVTKSNGRIQKEFKYVSPEEYSTSNRESRPFWHRTTNALRNDLADPEPSEDIKEEEPTQSMDSIKISTPPENGKLPFRKARTDGPIFHSSSAVPTEHFQTWKDEFDEERGLEFRYSRSRLWTDLETHFQSSSFGNLQWNPRPKTAGLGPEVAYFGEINGSIVGFRIGTFRGKVETNSHREGAFFVRETSQIETYWADFEMRKTFKQWLFYTVGFGGFIYHLKTDLETNVPAFVYDTATATGAFGAIGIGGGIETPWSFPVRFFAATNFWLPCCRPGASFEWGLGQVSAGAALRYE